MDLELHHPLLREFPAHHDTIHHLKTNNTHFRRLFDEYHQLDKSIYRIEEEIDHATDPETEDLKKRRLWNKDQLYRLILEAESKTA